MISPSDVVITTFVSPHLFWFIYHEDPNRNKLLDKLKDILQENCIRKPSSSETFDIGEVVAVQIGDRLCRGVIKNKFTQYGSCHFVCWLIDYGVMLKIGNVFKLPTDMLSIPPLAYQTSLMNVIYFKKNLNFDNTGQAISNSVPIPVPSLRSRNISMELLASCNKLKFKLEKVEHNIYFGDILYQDNKTNCFKSFKQYLIDKSVLMPKEQQFADIEDYINSSKDDEMMLLENMCYEIEDILADIDICSALEKLKMKYSQEFNYRELTDDEKSMPLSRNTKHQPKQSLDCTSTPENECSVKESVPKKLSKRAAVLELVKRQRGAQISDHGSEVGSSNHHDSSSRTDVMSKEINDEKLVQKVTSSEEICDQQFKDCNSSVTDTDEELVKRQIDAQITDHGSVVESSKHHDSSSTTDVMSKKINDEKLVQKVTSSEEICNQQFKDWNSSVTDTDEDTTKSCRSSTLSEKKIAQKNSLFVPAGACYSIPHLNKGRPRKNASKLKSLPSESISIKDENSCEEFSSLPETNEENSCKEFSPPSETKEENHTTVDTISEDSSSNNIENKIVSDDLPNKRKIKPHCSCNQCEHWTDESGWYTNHNFDKNAEVKIMISGNEIQLKLFRDENDGYADVEIISLDYSSMTKLQKQTTPKLLVHGVCLPSPRIDIANINFHPDIHNSLKQLGYKKPKRIQYYVWPALFRNQHVFILHGAKTGKSMAYLPVLCTFLLEKNDRYDFHIKIAGAPIIIILCANTRTCEQIYDLIKILLGKNRTKVSLITYPITHINTSHIDLLVTTPLLLVDLMKSKAINLKRLCHFVIDDGDRIFSRYHLIIEKFLEVTQTMLSNRVQSKPVQLIVCAEHWNKHISNLNKRLQRTPMVCIGNFMEAALYGKVQFSFEFINSACKEQKLKSLLKDTHRFCKSVIICKEDEIEDIQTTLMLKGIDATVISEDLSKENILHLEEVWTKAKAGQYTVLVCSDFMLNTMLSVTCASMLIHYSLPVSWTKFIKRFGCLLENCNSPLQTKENKIACQSIVLCDETCMKQMQKFFKYLDGVEFKNKLSSTWKECAQESQCLEEIEKIEKNVGLCDNLKLLGVCSDVHCNKRHTLCKELDVSKNLPSFRKIRFKIVNIHDVTNYSIQLLQHSDHTNDMKTVEYNNNLVQDLTNVLNNKRTPVENAIRGQLYAVFVSDNDIDDEYHRGELIDINEDNIKIKLIDEGSIVNTTKRRLYVLPREFEEENEPRKLLEVYLGNLVPPYQDDNFSAKSFFNLKTMLDGVDYKKTIFSADVHLQLADTLWIMNVQEDVDLSDKVISGFQLTREILRKKLAVSNSAQMQNLQELCKKIGIPVIHYNTTSNKQIKKDKIEAQWAYLSKDEVEEVIFCSAVSPDEFYVRLNKFSDLLYVLQKEIQLSLTTVNYPRLEEIKEGTICLVKDEEYERAVILKLEGEEALCFSVDFGYEIVCPITDLKYIQPHFITKLPFQSIRCRLYGLKPTLEEWQADSTDTLYYYAFEPGTDIFRILYVKLCDKDSLGLKQNAYSVLLKDSFGEKKSLVNDLYIQSGFARCSEEIVDFEIPEKNVSDQTEDEDINTIIDICERTKVLEENTNSSVVAKTNYINEDLELFCDDDNPADFIRELLKNSENRFKSTSNRDFLPIQAAPKVDYYTPEVLWSQNENTVKISIRLPDVVDHELTLTKGRILKFRTVQNGKPYNLNLILYEAVGKMLTTSGLVFKITLNKIINVDWPRLILSKNRARNIRYDVDTIVVKEEKKKFLEFPKEIDGGSNSDGDIDIMYNVVSDLESDFDAEIEQDSELLQH